MKFNQFRFIIPVFAIILLNSCKEKDGDLQYSADPTFITLKFAANKTIKGLETAVFTLQYDALLNDSIIVNLDSLPFQTRIDSVFPVFGFRSTSGSKLYFKNGESRFTKAGKDTIDFTQVESIENTAADKVRSRTYKIRVNVHKVIPELYVWNKVVGTNIDAHNAEQQKTVIFNNSFFYFLNNNTSSYLYKSVDGYVWTPNVVTGMPANATLNDVTEFKSKLYMSNNNDKIHSSSDGSNWTEKTYNDYNFKTILFVINDSLRAVMQSKIDLKYRFASSSDGENWIVREKDEIPANFPISNFTALSFYSRSGKQKALVIGGKNANGVTLTTSWSTEAKVQNGKTYWVDFSIRNQVLDTLGLGASLFAYDNRIFLIGLRNDKKDAAIFYKVSIDEGFSWQTPDTINNVLPKSFAARSFHSALVYKPTKYSTTDTYTQEQLINMNRIFIIGGKSNTNVLSDIWHGKLNRKSFLRQ